MSYSNSIQDLLDSKKNLYEKLREKMNVKEKVIKSYFRSHINLNSIFDNLDNKIDIELDKIKDKELDKIQDTELEKIAS